MQVLIIEDEMPAVQRLTRLLQKIDPFIEVVDRLDSVESSVSYLRSGPAPELIFVDIHLADGHSFDIFAQTSVSIPLIFTTAFDQYALKAFKMNSIDYLLKPIDEEELRQAITKFKRLHLAIKADMPARLEKLLEQMRTGGYKERLMIKRGQQLHYLKITDLAHCYAEGKLCYAVDRSGNRHLLEMNLARLEPQLPPQQFYRVNRQLLVNIESVRKVHTWLGGRLKLDLSPPSIADCTVSRERVQGFKTWLGE
ncbi:MAG: LytTR family DNA-binding domain-containing protein [Bacteroidota bacterium]|nr:LytTR family DNA-binding domain-containing protein [Bacteroidota bacterium]MDP4245512.1 LytTR family DNA-binding domain-containing protein [Bacteroidota bacterium]MDP4258985.1 LytTR family DNA-binding domain-containing protein [Bacteroidota bacterium]